jgi:hypothetical protein
MASEAYRAAEGLRGGRYHTPQLANISEDDAILTGMGCVGVTNSTSLKPIIGTNGFTPCTAIIMYNPKTKTAGVIHNVEHSPEALAELLAKVRQPDAVGQSVQVHVMGCPKYGDNPDDSRNVKRRARLQKLVDDISTLPDVQIKTFDVYDKKKPHAVAIDTRNGKLIRGSDLFQTEDEAEHDACQTETPKTLENAPLLFDGLFDAANNHFRSWERSEGHYDGTLPANQKGISFP